VTAAGVDLARIRDLEGRRRYPWARRALLALLALPVVLGLSGALGQETMTRSAASPQARLALDAPSSHPRLILAPGYINGMQMNTIEPAPTGEASRGPRLVFSYDELSAGDELVAYLQFQTNPTTTGGQDATVSLDDATRPLARVDHTITVLP
jgi:hypothetical protein